MTANHAHTPSTEQIRRLFVAVYPHPNPDEAFDRWFATVEAAAKVEAYREAQQIVAGDMTIDEQRGRRGADKVDAAYLIRELDQEIQELQEPGHD